MQNLIFKVIWLTLVLDELTAAMNELTAAMELTEFCNWMNWILQKSAAKSEKINQKRVTKSEIQFLLVLSSIQLIN